ncbi:tripartite motif-containing protein 2-like isoform X2 [Lineus longissimus]|uniref:tripartite motif-containing protein 2-like isoform X2 n=1 Tax=Lineus longissimus TaxID=88925 RepID=UPI00315D3E2A
MMSIAQWVKQVTVSTVLPIKMADDRERIWESPRDHKFLSCGICFGEYVKPKVLPCLHTFCEHCLDRYIPSESLSVSCPTCQKQSILPKNGVSALQNNLLIGTLMDLMAAEKDCVVCQAQGKMATKCQECDGFLCDSCAEGHKEDEVTASHNVVKLSELALSDGVDSTNDSLCCSSHEGQTFQFYCNTCETAICEKCTEMEHADHVTLPLQDAMDDIKTSLQTNLEHVKAKYSLVQEALVKVEEVQTNLTSNYNECETDILKNFELVEDLVARRKHRLIDDLQVAYDRKHSVMKEQKQMLANLLDTIDSCCELTENAVKHGNETDILLVKKEMSEKLTVLSSPKKQFLPDENDLLVLLYTDMVPIEKVIKRFGSVKTNSAVAHETAASGEGLKQCFTGVKTTIGLTTKDRKGDVTKSGYGIFTAELTASSGKVTIPEVVDNGGGAYDLCYIATEDGAHQLDINLYGDPIKGSPFKIKSVPKPDGYELKPPSAGKVPSKSSSRQRTKRSTSTRSQGSNRRSNPIEDDLLDRIGSRGRNKGEFTNPQGLCTTSDGKILVADSNNQNIQVFNNTGDFKFRFGIRGRTAGQLQRPTCVGVTLNGNYVISDYDNKWVSIHGQDGKYLNKIGTGKLLGPKGIAVDKNGHIIVVDNKASCVFIFQSNGKMIHKFGSRGNMDHQFAGPHYVAVNDENDIIVSDFHNHCIKVFDSEGSFLFAFGSNGEGNGQFNAPTGVATDEHGNILVADWGNSRIQVFDNTGSFLSYVNTQADALYGPQGIAVTSDGNVVVADSGNHCLKIYKYLQ